MRQVPNHPEPITSAQEIRYPETIRYPESDGKPMGETDIHITAIIHLISALRHFFRLFEQVYVAGDLLLYYEEANPQTFVVPDVFVVKGTRKEPRRIYKLWEEKIVPSVIFEITSRSTRLEDLATKRGLYEMLGVREYFLFDPLNEYLAPRLQGYRAVSGEYQRLNLQPDGTLYSEELGVILRPEDTLLRLVDSATGLVVPTLDEAVERAEEEAARAEQAESEIARLTREIERLRQAAKE